MASDLDCRAFTGTLEWQPDEKRPMLSTRGLRRLVLLRGLHDPNAIDVLRFSLSLPFAWPAIARPRRSAR